LVLGEGMTLKLRKDFTTHMPMVIKLVQMTKGPVLELGSGIFSTPLLHWLCHESGRRLETYEDEKLYFNFANKFRSANHKIYFVEDWDKIAVDKHWDVALIDHVTRRRSVEALRLKDQVDYMILHDSEVPEHYGYDRVFPQFKFIHHWRRCKAWTAVVSNTKDLSGL
jgi:hypothetical protein